jgi:hypothetical protein
VRESESEVSGALWVPFFRRELSCAYKRALVWGSIWCAVSNLDPARGSKSVVNCLLAPPRR